MKNETYDNEILEMALQGYESMKRKMDEKIAEVRKMLLGEFQRDARAELAAAPWRMPAKPTQHTHRTRKPYTFSEKGREARLAGTKRYWARKRKEGAKSK